MRGFLKKKHTTKAERVFAEELKRQRIKYKAKVKINGQEIDFLIGNIAVEINGHKQRTQKNSMLLEYGFLPVNFTNKYVLTERAKLIKDLTDIKNNYGTSKYHTTRST